MDAMSAFEDFNSLPGMVALEGWFTNVLWIVYNTQCNEDQITIQRVILNCGENMEVLLGDGSWVCNKHQNQFTRNKEGSQNNCGDSQSNCLSGMQFIFVFYMFQVLLVRWSFWF